MHTILRSLAVTLLVAASAAAQVVCGTTVVKGEQLTLTEDLGPCDNDDSAALIVDGGRLDLGGRTVTCADTDIDGDLPQGVVLFGKKARVTNGTIVGCSNGVGLGGSGKHLVQDVTIVGSADDGVDILSDSVKNKIIGVTVQDSASDGILVRGDKNKLTDNAVSGSGGDGIELAEGADKNKVLRNTATSNGNNGIEVNGIKNKLTDCTADGNGSSGMDLGGSKNKVRGGSGTGNALFDLDDCPGNSVKNFSAGTVAPECQ